MTLSEKQAWLQRQLDEHELSPGELAKLAQPLADAAGYSVKFNQQIIWNFQKTAKKIPGWFRYVEEALRRYSAGGAKKANGGVQIQPAARSASGSDIVEMVGIRRATADFGLGAVFTDEAPEMELLQFPKPWVESITYTSPALLSWVRARGSSMKPTINDGDMILLDHSQRKVEDQDDIWAFTVGDTRAIKRLRVKGDRYQILSDNDAIPIDEEPIDFVNIVGRVIFVGSRT